MLLFLLYQVLHDRLEEPDVFTQLAPGDRYEVILQKVNNSLGLNVTVSQQKTACVLIAIWKIWKI